MTDHLAALKIEGMAHDILINAILRTLDGAFGNAMAGRVFRDAESALELALSLPETADRRHAEAEAILDRVQHMRRSILGDAPLPTYGGTDADTMLQALLASKHKQ